MRILYLLLLIQLPFLIPAQDYHQLCSAVSEGNFRKVEKEVIKIIKAHEDAVLFDNGPGSQNYAYHIPLDSITSILKKLDCVEDAYWDKCQQELLLYPGHSAIGVRFKTSEGIVEKCFNVQEGQIKRNNNLFGWLRKSGVRDELVYKGMADCEGYIEKQKSFCNEVAQEYIQFEPLLNDNKIPYQPLLGAWVNVEDQNDTLIFKLNNHGGSVLMYHFSARELKECIFSVDENHNIPNKGYYIIWGGYHCILNPLSDDQLEIQLSNLSEDRTTYRKAGEIAE